MSDQRRIAPVTSGLLDDLIDQLFTHTMRTGRPLDPPLLIVVDEAANTQLQDLPEWAATLSGLGVQLVTVWQSIAQIQAAYGPQAGAILTNHPTKLFYPGMSDVDGLQTASTLLGQEYVPGMLQRSYLRPEEAGPSLVQFAPPDVVRQLKPGTGLLLANTLPPAVIDLLAPGPSRLSCRTSAALRFGPEGTRWVRLI